MLMEMTQTMLDPAFGDQAAEAASLLRAMSNSSRLLVLCHLAGGVELSVSQICERVGLSQSALSQHLAKLREEGLVATRKQAQAVFYRVADPRAERLLVLLQEIYCPELGGGTSRNFANG